MKPFIVVNLPLGMCVDNEILSLYGYNFFVGNNNIDEQWERLEKLRKTGGLIVVQPDAYSAIRELLDSYIGEDGFIKDCGLHNVHTKEHGDFCVILYHNKPDVMAERAFLMRNNKEE